MGVTGDEEVQGQINAYGSPIGANSREIRRDRIWSARHKSKHQSSGIKEFRQVKFEY